MRDFRRDGGELSLHHNRIARQYGVKVVGRTEGPVERFFAISAERRLKHPGVVAISAAARSELFAAASVRA